MLPEQLMSVGVILLLERMLQQVSGSREIIVPSLDAGEVIQSFEVVRVEADCSFKLALGVIRLVGRKENRPQLVMRRGIFGIFGDEGAIFLFSVGVAVVREIQMCKVETRISILGIDGERFLILGLSLLPVPCFVECVPVR